MKAEFYNRKNGKFVEASSFITEDDARLKALALNWNCVFVDYAGKSKNIVCL